MYFFFLFGGLFGWLFCFYGLRQTIISSHKKSLERQLSYFDERHQNANAIPQDWFCHCAFCGCPLTEQQSKFHSCPQRVHGYIDGSTHVVKSEANDTSEIVETERFQLTIEEREELEQQRQEEAMKQMLEDMKRI